MLRGSKVWMTWTYTEHLSLTWKFHVNGLTWKFHVKTREIRQPLWTWENLGTPLPTPLSLNRFFFCVQTSSTGTALPVIRRPLLARGHQAVRHTVLSNMSYNLSQLSVCQLTTFVILLRFEAFSLQISDFTACSNLLLVAVAPTNQTFTLSWPYSLNLGCLLWHPEIHWICNARAARPQIIKLVL